jgi:hypothetical protein
MNDNRTCLHHTGRIIESNIGKPLVNHLSILSIQDGSKSLHFARSISTVILNDGIVRPIRVIEEIIDLKQIERKEKNSLTYEKELFRAF